MTVFEDFSYERPDIKILSARFDAAFQAFRDAKTKTEAEAAFESVNQLRRTVDTQFNLVEIRHTVDTDNAFYKAENDFMDEAMPQIEGKTTAFYKLLSTSPYRSALEAKWGKQLFNLADAALKSFSDDVIPLAQEENKWASEYTKLVAAAKIPFAGEERTLAQLGPFRESADRAVRKAATDAYFGYFEANEQAFDDIYDQLVRVRTAIAHKLGFDNYADMSYYRMARIGYDKQKVTDYRETIRRSVVPVVSSLYERQRERIGVDHFFYYDEPYQFKSGNPKPKGDADWIIAGGRQMYHDLSPETGRFFDFMLEHHLLDLLAKKGKAAGGYCTYLFDYGAPYIFSNFNGTSDDIDVLTHEAGHAFQVYTTQTELPEYRWPTYEGAEIHSMSMEFFTWPWMKLFFEEDTDKRKFAHLSGTLFFLPYGVSVDEFQHVVYEHPEMTPRARKQAWKAIEAKYLPHRNYGDNAYLSGGGFWQRQGHIYESPFYYIDYTLAQVCALQFWTKSMQDFQSAWGDYLKLCRAGGSRSFLELVALAGLKSPFEPDCVPGVVRAAEQWLAAADDRSF